MVIEVVTPIPTLNIEVAKPAIALAPRPSAHGPIRIGFLGNSKANVELLFEGVVEVLAADRRLTGFGAHHKLTAQGSASTEVHAEIAQGCDVLISAMSD